MITIKKSPTADSRTCDAKNTPKDQLLKSSFQHIEDVIKGMRWFKEKIENAMTKHDFTKIDEIDMFYKDFQNNFETIDWWLLHKQKERHHLSQTDGIREDVDLVDVIEFLVDGVMAGLARSGTYRKETIPEGLLEKAFNNTIQKLLKEIEIEK